jgi:hypothetical protein
MKKATVKKPVSKTAVKSPKTEPIAANKETTPNTPEANLNQMNVQPNSRANEGASLQENSNSESKQNARKGNM